MIWRLGRREANGASDVDAALARAVGRPRFTVDTDVTLRRS
jgi:hypothetical protein